jgi:glucose/arabinose dehydrogenase
VAALVLAACGAHSAGNSSTAATAPAKSAARAHKHRSRYASVPLAVPAGNGAAPLNKPRRLTLPRGWRAEVWARVFDARLETWTPEGALLVSAPYSNAIFKLVPRAQPSDPPLVEDMVKHLNIPQGLAFDTLGGQEVLYVAESNQLDRYQWKNGELGARTVIVPNLPDTHPSGDDNHRFKNVVVGSDHTVYVDIGSASNASPQNPADRPPRASVLAVNPDGSHLRVFATGIRNGDGLSFAPDGTLWTAVNERDDIHYPFHRSYGGASDAFNQGIPGYVNNHPPDELARLTAGRNLGWPFCNPDPDVKPGVAGTRFDYATMRFDADPETNAGSRRLRCSKLKPIERGIAAHSAPLGFHFLERSSLPARWRGGAVVGTHGSWDRKPPRSPAVLWLPWNRAKRTLGSAITIVSGFQQGGRWGRPVDAVPGPDGALYVTDDTANAIYRIVPAKGS